MFPLRLTGLDRALGLGTGPRRASAAARRWYRDHGRPVTIVIPSYRDAALVATAGRQRSARTTPADRVRIIVADDASGPEHLAALRADRGIEVVAGEANGGFAVNANRGLRAADPEHDVVLLNSDVIAAARLAGLPAARRHAAIGDVGIAGAKLLYPDNRIQYAGTIRNAGAPEWFDHRYRGKPADWGPADVAGPTLAATGACMYIRRDVAGRGRAVRRGVRRWATRTSTTACARGRRATRWPTCPSARLYHHESATRGTDAGRAGAGVAARLLGALGASSSTHATVLTDDGRLRVVYVTEGTDRRRRSSRRLRAPQRPRRPRPRRRAVDARGRARLVRAALPGPHASPTTTSWPRRSRRWTRSRSRPGGTPPTAVWRASVVHGIPVYFVQDIETSYYPDAPSAATRCWTPTGPSSATSRPRRWNRDRLRELGLRRRARSRPGWTSTPSARCDDVARRDDMVLALGRSDPLKNLPLTLDAWRRLPEPRPELCLFGIEPELADRARASATSRARPTRRSTSCSTRPRCSCRPRRTRASACRCWRRWRPAAPWCAPTPTATGTSASTASTA